MDEKQLTIEQVEKIMGWSYPTALKFANRHGEMVSGKWQVPSGAVWNEISVLVDRVDKMKGHYLRETVSAYLKEPA